MWEDGKLGRSWDSTSAHMDLLRDLGNKKLYDTYVKVLNGATLRPGVVHALAAFCGVQVLEVEQSVRIT